jgi:hypothetical protein
LDNTKVPVVFEVLAGELLSILNGVQQDRYQIQPKQTKSNNPYLVNDMQHYLNLTTMAMRKTIDAQDFNLQTEQGAIKIQTCHKPRSTPVDVKTTRSKTILSGQTVSVTLFAASTSASVSRISYIGMLEKKT